MSKTLLNLLLGYALTGIFVQHAVAEKRPNIVWFFSDDHSYQTIGAYGGRLASLNPTPNLDKLAREGMRFDRCYVGNSICCPSRATMLTGKHSHANGILANSKNFNHDQWQFQKDLQKAGYATALIGKMHMNGPWQGFDYWAVLPGQGDYDDPRFITSDQGEIREKGYVSDVITDKAVNWLKNDRDPNKPFMLMVHHKAPHRKWKIKEEYKDLYEDVFIPEPDNLFDDYSTRGVAASGQAMEVDRHMEMPTDLKVSERYANDPRYKVRNEWFAQHQPTGKELVKWKYQQYLKDYLRCVWSVDVNVGRMMDELKAMGLDKNTIVMYSSDQGFYMGEHGWFDKRFMYEESFRTPLLAWWPGKIKAGSVNSDLVQNIDFASTFLDLAGVKAPEEVHGESIVPLLKGETPDDWRKSLYYHYYQYGSHGGAHCVRRHEGVFDGRWKLIRFYGTHVPNGEEFELYDLQNDPTEMNNIYNHPENKAQIERLKKELANLIEQYDVPDDVVANSGGVAPPELTLPKSKMKLLKAKKQK
ncbi:sulfatase family protein [Pontiella sulfatireligans]|uniref:Arylsulfatase n=1 Tax=Pontiella sulfatireligans TaxID=2750658 RepID=A0A6C2UF83_9BACT|nr:sulfatase [Pontiella sulfatireligans]SPS74127.1 sulfatase S1_11 [Kiritimatiellales bacterium]VGO18081.1 Arylsulfatase [Pontiella sulfatireligans]